MPDRVPTTSIPAGVSSPQPVHGRGYWSIVWRQFRKNIPAVIGLVILVLIFSVAVFAPLLANKYPYYWKTPDEGLTFPLLRALTCLDLIYLAAAAAVLLMPVTAWVLRRAGCSFWSLNPVRRAAAVNLLLLAVAIAGLLLFYRVPSRIFVDKTVQIDGELVHYRVERDYRQEAAERDDVSCLFAPIPWSPTDITTGGKPFELPGDEHILGTDSIGQSVASRMVYGARTSLAVGFISVGISVLIGVLVGGVSGYFGGGVDLVLQRVVEMFMCFPTFFLILLIVAMYGAKLWLIMVAIGLVGWSGISRLTRAEMLRVRTLDYVTAARALGLSPLRIVLRHAVPNTLAPVLVSATFGIAGAVGAEAALGFLGIGDPNQPSWGGLMNGARTVFSDKPILLIVPGLAIFITILAYNLVGEGLRDAIDPRLKA